MQRTLQWVIQSQLSILTGIYKCLVFSNLELLMRVLDAQAKRMSNAAIRRPGAMLFAQSLKEAFSLTLLRFPTLKEGAQIKLSSRRNSNVASSSAWVKRCIPILIS
eukprot:3773574-Amphidinium_carterae.3